MNKVNSIEELLLEMRKGAMTVKNTRKGKTKEIYLSTKLVAERMVREDLSLKEAIHNFVLRSNPNPLAIKFDMPTDRFYRVEVINY